MAPTVLFLEGPSVTPSASLPPVNHQDGAGLSPRLWVGTVATPAPGGRTEAPRRLMERPILFPGPLQHVEAAPGPRAIGTPLSPLPCGGTGLGAMGPRTAPPLPKAPGAVTGAAEPAALAQSARRIQVEKAIILSTLCIHPATHSFSKIYRVPLMYQAPCQMSKASFT